MNTKWIVRGAVVALAMAAAMSAQASGSEDDVTGRGPVLNGPLLQGISLNGPILQGISLNGPILQGISMQGISLNGPVLQGPVIQGVILNGPMLQSSSLQGALANSANAAYGQGRGVFNVPASVSMHVVPGHSVLSGIAVDNVEVRLAN